MSLVPDLRNTRVIVVVFAMDGCGPCEEYVPRLRKQVEQLRANGAPFVVWVPGTPLQPGTIPVLLYDAASADPVLTAFADKLKISATPTTCVLTSKGGVERHEGALGQAELAKLLNGARIANN